VAYDTDPYVPEDTVTDPLSSEHGAGVKEGLTVVRTREPLSETPGDADIPSSQPSALKDSAAVSQSNDSSIQPGDVGEGCLQPIVGSQHDLRQVDDRECIESRLPVRYSKRVTMKGK